MKIYLLNFGTDHEGTTETHIYKTAKEAQSRISTTTKQECDYIELAIWDGTKPEVDRVADFYSSFEFTKPYIAYPAAYQEYLAALQ